MGTGENVEFCQQKSRGMCLMTAVCPLATCLPALGISGKWEK